ncbi:hypothetical protein NQ314_019340 [Rhamnusium bicolor]|uniref:WW domain-containing protein n=1 Tax=Rhamnusium bicolor TaxID=1586634 RepID=A0AAV8WNU7_9CUCU|nr:hypothetical protein NQ314_019340 [Rhamnusium bicolor]
MAELQDMPPAGWECRIDETTGKYYYINHYTKTTTWEDPRTRHRPLNGTPKRFTNVQTEYIPLQHGSPDLRRNYVYPSKTSPIPAFQMPAHMSPKSVPLQDMKPRMSPLTVKSPKIQDSSLTVLTDTDEAVAKISAMFPTVSETHIRLLLKKYHNREALVISALQVEKYPITTPGPFATPPQQRNIHHSGVHAPLHMTPPLGFRTYSRGGSPIFRPGSCSNSTYTGSPRIGDGFRSSPRPHSSPKLKLRSNISVSKIAKKASGVLEDIGYNKKDAVKVARQKLEAKKEEERREEEEEKKAMLPSPQIRIRTSEEKRKSKIEKQTVEEDITSIPTTSTGNLPISQSRQSLKSLLKEKSDKEKIWVIEEYDSVTHSKNLISTNGPNSVYAKGANEKLLLEDYINWQGSNTSIRKGPQGLAKGPNASLLSNRTYQPCGPNLQLRKGPSLNRAKGSILTQLKSVVVGESRGK